MKSKSGFCITKRTIKLVLVGTVLMLFISKKSVFTFTLGSQGRNCSLPQFPVDIVYTWVNGSDPDFVAQLAHQDKSKSNIAEDTSESRFQDFNQLLYSLRSVELYAPWINRVFIVTNGQIPSWLNESEATIVTHDTIFENLSHLPTFNAQSIEAHLHKIPGLTENFIYFNDDISLTRQVCLSDFWTSKDGFTVRSNSHKKKTIKKCSDECLALRNNGICDEQCNNTECLFDHNDCEDQLPKSNSSAWEGAVEFTHVMLTRKLGIFEAWRTKHVPFMMNKRIIEDLNANFGTYYNATSAHHTRQRNEVQTQFAYINWLVFSQIYRSKVIGVNNHQYIGYGKDTISATRQLLAKTLKKIDRITFLCVNDLIDYRKSDAAEKQLIVQDFYNKLYPKPSKFEMTKKN